MEDSTFYLRFLIALPTLRLTLGHKAAEFNTTALLDQIRKEPLSAKPRCSSGCLGTPLPPRGILRVKYLYSIVYTVEVTAKYS